MKHFANLKALTLSGLLPSSYAYGPHLRSYGPPPIASYDHHGEKHYVYRSSVGSSKAPRATVASQRPVARVPVSRHPVARVPVSPQPPPPPDPAIAVARAIFVSEETALGREVTREELVTIGKIAVNRVEGRPDGHRLPSAHARGEQLRAALGLGNIRRGVVASGHRLIIGAAIPSATPPKPAPVAASPPKPRDDRRLSSGALLSEVRAQINVGPRAGGVVVTAKSLILGVPKSSASSPSARIEKAGRGR